MKKFILFLVSSIFLCMACFSVDIETALKQTADQFSESIEQGTTVAIIGISSRTKEMSDFMLDELTLGFVQKRKLTVANRSNLDAIKAEMNFQLSGEVSDDTMQQLGAMVGAQIVIHGNLKPIGKNFNLVIQALDVTTAAVVDMCRIRVEPNDITKSLLSDSNIPAAVYSSSKLDVDSGENKAKEDEMLPENLDEYQIIDLTEKPDVEYLQFVNWTKVPVLVTVYQINENEEWILVGNLKLKKYTTFFYVPSQAGTISITARRRIFRFHIENVKGKKMTFSTGIEITRNGKIAMCPIR